MIQSIPSRLIEPSIDRKDQKNCQNCNVEKFQTKIFSLFINQIIMADNNNIILVCVCFHLMRWAKKFDNPIQSNNLFVIIGDRINRNLYSEKND